MRGLRIIGLMFTIIVFATRCGPTNENKAPIVWKYELGDEVCVKPTCIHAIITSKMTNYAETKHYYFADYFDNNGQRQSVSVYEFEISVYKKPVKEILKEVFTGDNEEEEDYETEY